MYKRKIIIPVKGNSVRCKKKNYHLLPYLLQTMKSGDKERAIVVSEDMYFKKIAESYNVEFILEEPIDGQCELDTCLWIAGEMELDDFVLYPTTTPFKNKDLITNCEKKFNDGDFDLVTSYQEVVDRSIYYINQQEDGFLIPNQMRMGSLCGTIKMVDGACYVVRKEFLENNNTNFMFWNNGKIGFVKNDTHTFLDVDEEYDLDMFKRLVSTQHI